MTDQNQPTPPPGICQLCGDEYGPWTIDWICETCLEAKGGDS